MGQKDTFFFYYGIEIKWSKNKFLFEDPRYISRSIKKNIWNHQYQQHYNVYFCVIKYPILAFSTELFMLVEELIHF